MRLNAAHDEASTRGSVTYGPFLHQVALVTFASVRTDTH